MSPKLKCIVVDDDPLSIEVIKDLAKGSYYVEIVRTFNSPKEFLNSQKHTEYDFCLLDILMSEMDGLTVAKNMNNKSIVFYTSEETILKAALNLSPIDILTKPATKERFDSVIEKVTIFLKHDRKQREYELFHIAEANGKQKIILADIVYVVTEENDHRNKRIVLKDGITYTIMNYNFRELLEICPHLVQVNRSELISFDVFYRIDFDVITLTIRENDRLKQVSLSRLFQKDFMERYF